MKILLRWFRRRRHKAQREFRLEEIERLGYELLREQRSTVKRYMLKTPDGNMLDNHGMGWASTAEAYSAAKRHASTAVLQKPELEDREDLD